MRYGTHCAVLSQLNQDFELNFRNQISPEKGFWVIMDVRLPEVIVIVFSERKFSGRLKTNLKT